MKSVQVDDETYEKLRIMSRSTGDSISDSIDRLLQEWLNDGPPSTPPTRGTAPAPHEVRASTTRPQARADDHFLKVHRLYMSERVEGEFDVRTHSLRITTGPLAGRAFPSPSQAAIAVVENLNPGRANSNTNGRTFWRVDATGQPLRSLLGKR